MLVGSTVATVDMVLAVICQVYAPFSSSEESEDRWKEEGGDVGGESGTTGGTGGDVETAV